MRRSGKILIVIIGAVLAIALVISGGVFAKYINERSYGDRPLSAASFYFESNYLKPTLEEGQYVLSPQADSVEIELYNFENRFRVSEVECKYTVTVETGDEQFALSQTEYNVKKNDKGKIEKTTTKVLLSGLKQGHSYKVTVVAEGGYKKTMYAEIQIGEVKTGFYKNVQDSSASEYVILTVWSDYVKGDVNIEFPNGLIPDITDPMLSDIKNYDPDKKTYNEKAFKDAESFADEYSSRSYRFFKSDKSRVYTADDFTVKMGEVPADSANISNS